MAQAPGSRRRNVLFIAVDDLRCDLPCYGNSGVHAPNFDRLAARGLVFHQSHVQQAVCAASRASLLTGCRPDTTGVDFPYPDSFARDFLPTHPTLATLFHRAGYHTVGYGKIHHGDPLELLHMSERYNGDDFDGGKLIGYGRYALPENQAVAANRKPGRKLPMFECADVPDDAYGDTLRTTSVLATLARCARDSVPFFLLAGFNAPHTPYAVPKRYWDLYDPQHLPGPAAGAPTTPPTIWSNFVPETGAYDMQVNEETIVRMRHGYYASVSYLDAQIGRLLDALDTHGLTDSTLVFLWSDHGYHLGERQHWGKRTPYELDTRAPVMLAGPDIPRGASTDSLIEHIDFYPTLCDYAGLPKPDYLEGDSFAPLIANPRRAWKPAVFCRAPRLKGIMGRMVRTPMHRYVEWRHEAKNTAPEVLGRELYDLVADPLETRNLAADPATAPAALVTRLAQQLAAGWRAARPA
jgi:iduronate 2-sulfatase